MLFFVGAVVGRMHPDGFVRLDDVTGFLRFSRKDTVCCNGLGIVPNREGGQAMHSGFPLFQPMKVKSSFLKKPLMSALAENPPRCFKGKRLLLDTLRRYKFLSRSSSPNLSLTQRFPGSYQHLCFAKNMNYT